MVNWPKRPTLATAVRQELELHGVDAIRGILINSSDGFSGTSRASTVDFGNFKATRGEMQDWLKWRASRDACWIKSGVVAAILAAVFSLFALLK
jgi:hypothetical protein